MTNSNENIQNTTGYKSTEKDFKQINKRNLFTFQR